MSFGYGVAGAGAVICAGDVVVCRRLWGTHTPRMLLLVLSHTPPHSMRLNGADQRMSTSLWHFSTARPSSERIVMSLSTSLLCSSCVFVSAGRCKVSAVCRQADAGVLLAVCGVCLAVCGVQSCLHPPHTARKSPRLGAVARVVMSCTTSMCSAAADAGAGTMGM